MLIYDDLFGHHDRVKTAIDRIKTYNPLQLGFDKPYYVCYSGGKDSDCIRILMELSGVPYDLVHNHTTMDAPETVYYIRSVPGVHINYPDTNIYRLIVKKHMPPTRLVRYCCSYFKENNGSDRFVVTGVRWAESTSRKKNRGLAEIQSRKLSDKLTINNDNDINRNISEFCARQGKHIINPIIDWSDDDVWEFLHFYGCQSNPLYQCGHKRVGCLGCPMSCNALDDFKRYPIFKENYIRAFDRMLASEYYQTKKKVSWSCGEEVFEWWLGLRPNIVVDEDQLSFDDF